MTVALSQLRVSASMDASGYSAGATAIDAANRRMADSGMAAGAALAQQDVAAGRVGGTLVTLTKSYVAGYGEVARFSKQVQQLQTQFELGKVSADRAALIYSGLADKFQLYANATEIAAKGNRDFAAVIDSVNAKAGLQVEILNRQTSAMQQLNQAQQAQAAINSRLGVLPAGSGAGSAQASADALMAEFGGLDGIARSRAQQTAQAFTDELNGRLIAGTSKSARDSAATFQAELDREDEISRLKAQQIGQNFANDLASRLTPGTQKSARDSAAVFQQEMDRLDGLAQAKALQIGQNFQQDLNASFGIGLQPKSAQASAAVFQDVDRQAKALDDLKAKYDPVYAAQRRYESSLEDISKLSASGALQGAAYATAVNTAKNAFADAVSESKKLEEGTKALSSASVFGNTQFMALSAALRHMFDAMLAGRPPTQALAMELGNLSYGLSGSGGFMGAVKAIGSGIVGWLSPAKIIFLEIAAAIGLSIGALTKFESMQATIRQQLTGAGRASGASVGDINQIAALGSANGLSIASAAGIAGSLAATGKVGVDSLAPLVKLGHDFATTMGIDAATAAKTLAQSFADPVRGADTLNERLGFLDANTKNLIQSLVAQGDREQAIAILTDRLKGSIASASETTTIWGRIWNDVTNKISDGMTIWGRFLDRAAGGTGGASITQQITDATIKLLDLQKQQASSGNGPFAGFYNSQIQKQIDDLIAKIEQLRQKQLQEQDAANDAKLRQRSLEVQAWVNALEPGPDMLRRLTDQANGLNHAFADPAMQKYISGFDTMLVKARAAGAALSVALNGFDPVKNAIADTDAQIKALDDRSIATRKRLAEDKARRDLAGQSLSPQEYERRVQQAGILAAGGQTAIDANTAQKINLLGSQATVMDKVALAQLSINNAAREGITLTPQQIENARELAKEQALGTLQMKQQADSAKIEAATVDMAVGPATAYRLEQERMAQALRDKQPLSAQDIAAIKQQAAAAGEAAQSLEKMRVQSDIKFQTGTAFLSDEDIQIAQKLRGLYGNDIPAAMQSAEAAQIRFANGMKDLHDLTTSFGQDFLSAFQQGKSLWDAFGQAGQNALNKIASKLLDMAVNNLWSLAFPSGGGGFLSLLGLGGGGSSAVSNFNAGGSLAAIHHAGGMVGSGSQARYVHPAYFESAPRMHGGGGIDWAAGERPIIGLTGERVLNRSETAAYNSGKATPPQIKIYPVAGTTFDQKTDAQGNIQLVGRMIDDKLKTFSKKSLPSLVHQINQDPRAR